MIQGLSAANHIEDSANTLKLNTTKERLIVSRRLEEIASGRDSERIMSLLEFCVYHVSIDFSIRTNRD